MDENLEKLKSDLLAFVAWINNTDNGKPLVGLEEVDIYIRVLNHIKELKDVTEK